MADPNDPSTRTTQQDLAPVKRSKKDLNKLIQIMQKAKGGPRRNRTLDALDRSNPQWDTLQIDNYRAAAVNLLLGFGGFLDDIQYVINKSLPNIFERGGDFENNDHTAPCSRLTSHIKFMAGMLADRPKVGLIFESSMPLDQLKSRNSANCYIRAVGIWHSIPGNHVLLSDQKTSKSKAYLPTKNDCEKIIIKVRRDSARTEISADEALTMLEADFSKNNITLQDNWRMITKENFKIWFSKEGISDMAITYNPDKEVFRINYSSSHIYDYFEGRGFHFSKEILTRYFLSLKSKPFVILPGISGTGKTKIAQIFADYMCQDETPKEKQKRIAFISVRPDWMDNKGLLGFYNILDQKYYDTPFLALLLEAEKHPDKPYFVILDEMNLSKVEMYFSDFLSIIESRTADNVKGEPLLLHSLSESLTPSGRTIPNQLHIPQNVFITGTVNVDETTYMFSPKVLDRANVIEFNDVDLEGYMTNASSFDRFNLPNMDLRNELIQQDLQPFCSKNDYSKLLNEVDNKDHYLHGLLEILKKYNLHFGYRVINEISRFVWIAKKHMEDQLEIQDAFDIQILQKVLPKFHGTQAKLEKPLMEILSFCFADDHSPSDELIDISLTINEDARFPRSAQKIARMLTNLKAQGYTSFIE